MTGTPSGSAGTLTVDRGDLFADGGETGELMRALDHASGPLGPVATWPQSLRTCVRIILTSRQPMFVWWGPQLVNLYNDAYRAIVGGKHPAALGQPASQVWQEIWQEVGPRAATALRTNRGTYDEALLLIMQRHGYQEETYYTFSYSPVPNDDGSIGGIICANTDETQRIVDGRRLVVLRELASCTARARTRQEACSAGAEALANEPRDIPFALIATLDAADGAAHLAAHCGIAADHPAALAVGGPPGASPWRVAEALAARDLRIVDLPAGAHLPTGAWPSAPTQAAVLPLLYSGDSGRAGVLIVGLNPYRKFDAKYRDFLLLVAGQITAGIGHAQAYEEERRRAEALSELDRAKTLFFSNVSHELRTPLTLILGPLEDGLADRVEPLPPGQRARQEIVHRSGLRLLKLVNSLLDFSRIEAGRMRAAFAPTDLAALTAELASTFRSAVERAGMRLVVDSPPLASPIHVDRDLWEKIVLNLLSNAFKHTFAGAITVTLRERAGHAELTVADTGIGIAAEELPRLFERFHRVHGARSRTHEGTGIGLALVQELVRLHGGSVSVASEVGRGTAFTVAIPTGSAHLPHDQLVTGGAAEPARTRASTFVAEASRWLPDGDAVAEPQAGTGAATGPQAGAERGRVLLAEDNADMRDYVQRLLSARWQVEAVANGAEALTRARAAPPDLILSDVMMPELDGIGLLRGLRRDPATRHVPVILLSARAGEEAGIEGLEAGADDYLTKPFSAQELLARVGAHLQLKRERDRVASGVRRNELLLRLATDHARIGLVMLDEGHRYTFANPTYSEMLGLDPGELVGRSAAEVLGAAYGEEVRPRLERAFAGERVAYELALPAGGRRPRARTCAATFEPAFGTGDGRCVVAVLTDITERKQIEDVLRHQNARYATLIGQAPLGIYVIDADFRLIQVNPTARPVFSGIPGAVEGRDFAELLHIIWPQEFAAELVRIFRRTLETGEPHEEPERIEERSDRRVSESYEWRVDRIPQPDGRFGLVCYFRDISRQVQARRALAQHADELRRANVELESFASVASHDLQEPLRMISAYADVVQRTYGAQLDARGKGYLERIVSGAVRMRSLIHAVLGYSQVGKGQAEATEVPLRAVVDEILETLQAQVAAAAATVTIGELPTVRADRVRMGQLLQNLVANALKFTVSGRPPTVEVTSSDLGGEWLVRVADNGIGIPEQALGRIFQIFQRLHPVEQYPGSGIGLATCKKIVEQHGGRIGVESRHGEGSTFWFTLAKQPPPRNA